MLERVAIRKVEEEIEGLGALREAPAAEALPKLRKALTDRVGLLVAKAAKIAAEREFRDLVPDLLRAFDRLFENAVERDPQCWGKNAIADALRTLDHRESAVYLRGMRYVQMEPVWGRHEDTAQTLRGICLLALVACTDLTRGEILRCLVEALTEKEGVVRVEAARALAQMQGEEAALLLRLKARAGDAAPEVTGQVFDGLLRLEGESAVGFLAAFLNPESQETREEAALALGSSRLAGAVAPLLDAAGRTHDSGFRPVLLRALSLSRQESALEFLMGLVKTARLKDALDALEALAVHRGSAEIRRAVEGAVKGRDEELRRQFERLME